MLSITPNFSMSDIQKDLDQFVKGIEADGIAAFSHALKKMVDAARAKTRSEGSFNNITWDLRGSIGGVIVANHKIVETYFPPVSKGEEGRKKGIAYAQEVAGYVDDGDIMLVFCAGESYAGYVEAREDYDVITGSNSKLDTFLREFLK